MGPSSFVVRLAVALCVAISSFTLVNAAEGALVGWGAPTWETPQIAWFTNATYVACSSASYGVVLMADGTVRVFGSNPVGDLNVPSGLTNVIDVTAGNGTCVALTKDGRIVKWGRGAPVNINAPTNVVDIASASDSNWGLLSDGTIISFPGALPPVALNDAVAISASWDACVALRRNGSVYAWGSNQAGVLNVPSSATNVIKIATGPYHALALRQDGTVVAWGTNDVGQCNVPSDLTDVVSIAAGTFHSVALKRDGHVVAWGSNWAGQLDILPQYTDLSDIFATTLGTLGITQMPVVVNQPTNVTALAGRPVALTFTTVASSPISYQWFKDDQLLDAANNASLQFTNAQAAQAGVYRAEARTSAGSISSAVATLTVTPAAPSVVQLSGPIQAIEGTSTNLFVVAQGTEPLRYQWIKNGAPLQDQTNATLALSNLIGANAGQYTVSVENSVQTVTGGPIDVTVFEWPRISDLATNLNLLAGSDFKFTASASGTSPITYSWFSPDQMRFTAQSNSALFQNVQKTDEGRLFLIASNSFGVASNLVATVTVIDRAPVILVHPQNRTVTEGISFSLSVQAVGTEPLFFQWFKNDRALEGVTNSQIVWDHFAATDIGQYHVVVSNRLDAVTSETAVLDSALVPEVDWPSIGLAPVATNAFPLTDLTHAGDGSGRIFVTEQRGTVRILNGGQFLDTPFLDITARVQTGSDFGLFAIAFPPDYPTSGAFYVTYSRKSDRATVLSRFRVTADPNVSDAASEQILLVIPLQDEHYHSGQIAFGADGYLYFGVGDSDFQTKAQSPSSFLGKILRLDVSGSGATYSIPPTNPFVGQTGNLPEVWAIGLHNPWHFAFDRDNGDLFIADPGNVSFEEVDFLTKTDPGGKNFGWPFFEGPKQVRPLGTNLISAFSPPVAALDHTLSTALVGGAVYHGAAEDRMYGIYFSADYSNGKVWGLKRVNGSLTNTLLGQVGIAISSIGEDQVGNLYVTQRTSSPGVGYLIFKLYDSRRALPPSFGRVDANYFAMPTVTVSTPTPGATIHYTIDGMQPTKLSPALISGDTILITSNLTLKAFTERYGLADSDVVTAKYNLTASLGFSPVGSITNGTLVTITSTPPNSTIRYTIDGTDPTTNSTLYTGPFPLDGGKTVKAIATADNWTPSRIYAQFFGWLNFEPVVIQSIAGSGISGTNDAQGLAAQFNGPAGIAVAKDGTLFVVDSGNKSIRKISPNRQVTTFASGFIEPVGVCVDDAANVYVSDDGANQIFRFNPTGDRTLYAGTGALGYDDGPALQATFRYPREMEIDRDGNVYLTDWSNIRKITPAGEVSTFAVGAGTKPGLGLRNKTEVFVMLDEGTLYQITDGVFTAIAGTPQVNVHSDGVGTSAFFYNVFHDIAGDNGGNIIVGDYGVLRRIDTNGQTATLLERPLLPDPNSMKLIAGIAVDTKGNIFVSDSGDNRIKRISPDTDRDGVPDTDETFPLVVGVDDRFVDSDGDGMSNAEEYAAGTDPSVPDGIRVTVEVQNSQLNFSWSTLPGKVYRLQHSDDLKTWLDVDANGPTSQSSTTITPSGSKDFFRVLGE